MIRLALLSPVAVLATLAPPALDRLPVGAIKPAGWLKREAELMAEGFTGGLGFWSGGGISNSMWLAGKTDSADEQGGEYYMNGMVPLSCQIDAPHLRELREASIQKILKSVGVNGTLGGEIPHGDYTQKHTYWGRMIAVLFLESYAECEGEFAPNASVQRAVEDALVSHHKAICKRMVANDPPFTHGPWASARYQEILLGVQWLIDRGHNNTELWDLMTLVREQAEAVMQWEQWFVDGDPSKDIDQQLLRCWPNKSDPTEKRFMRHHGVNIMEAIKTGPAWYRVSRNTTDLANAAAALQWIDKWARSADGTFTAPDCIYSGSGPHRPDAGVETCSVVEEMFSLRTSYEITGSVDIFDRLEFVAFNAMPATTSADFTGNSYYHSVNQLQLDGKTGYEINGCCTGNVHQGWPKFIMGGVQTLRGDAKHIVISGYSPSTSTLKDGTIVSVAGQYPFADNVTLTISRAAGEAWALSLRIPCWATSARLLVVGAAALPAATCGFFDVPDLDVSTTLFTATLVFKHSVEVLFDKWTTPRGAVEIRRGPLLFTFPVPGTLSTTPLNGTAVQKTSVIVDNTKPWQIALKDPNTSLAFSGFSPMADVPFDRTKPPAKIRARACLTNPGVYRHQGKADWAYYVPDGPIHMDQCNSTVFDIDLVPIAHSHLRLTVLPVLADDEHQYV